MIFFIWNHMPKMKNIFPQFWKEYKCQLWILKDMEIKKNSFRY